jgi:hypothetical protein
VRVSANLCRQILLKQLLEHRKVMLEIVDRVLGLRGSGPREPGASFDCCCLFQVFVLRDASGQGAHHVESVRARDSRSGFHGLDTGIRNPETLGRCTRRKS